MSLRGSNIKIEAKREARAQIERIFLNPKANCRGREEPDQSMHTISKKSATPTSGKDFAQCYPECLWAFPTQHPSGMLQPGRNPRTNHKRGSVFGGWGWGKRYSVVIEIQTYQSHSFCQTQPVCWNRNIGLFVHPINLITDIIPVSYFLKKNTQASETENINGNTIWAFYSMTLDWQQQGKYIDICR